VPRILCVDYGERHTGVAVSDETRTIAQGLPSIHHENEQRQIEAIRKLVAEHAVDEVVVGLPISQSGRPSTRSEQVKAFATRLTAATGLPVVPFDERFSTMRANDVLEEAYGGGRHEPGRRPATGRNKKRKEAVDRIAATIILEDYLAARLRKPQ
jgi:putative Holliday junction resolvase